jgi:hypothetical protein
MTPSKNLFAEINAPCCWEGTQDADMPCACGPDERVLRAYIDGLPTLPPMTPEQREWCLSEIESVEGYDRRDYEQCLESELASGVLSAWTNYCRDKGML